jgi:predicted alpha/beta-fold hydrolase
MIVNMVEQAQAEGFDCVVINYRGLAGAGLYTPKLYSALNVEDQLEAMTFVYSKYCKPFGRQCFAMGLSTGANKVAHLMAHVGKESFISAAAIVCTCSDLKLCIN